MILFKFQGMENDELRQFIVSELKRRKLSTDGTFRIIQKRYEAVLAAEENGNFE